MTMLKAPSCSAIHLLMNLSFRLLCCQEAESVFAAEHRADSELDPLKTAASGVSGAESSDKGTEVTAACTQANYPTCSTAPVIPEASAHARACTLVWPHLQLLPEHNTWHLGLDSSLSVEPSAPP